MDLGDDVSAIQDRTGVFFETMSGTAMIGLMNSVAMCKLMSPKLMFWSHTHTCTHTFVCAPRKNPTAFELKPEPCVRVLAVPPLRDLYYRESGDDLYGCFEMLVSYYIHILPFNIVSSLIFSTWVYW